VEQWIEATNANRLATAADWVARLSTVGLAWENESEARSLASELVNCVSGAAEVMTDTGIEELDEVGLSTEVLDLVSTCAAAKGWVKSNR
jgi:hypothetical protein